MVYYMISKQAKSKQKAYIDASIKQGKHAENLLDGRVPHRVDGEVGTMLASVESIELVRIVDVFFGGSVVLNRRVDVRVRDEQNSLANIFFQLDDQRNHHRCEGIYMESASQRATSLHHIARHDFHFHHVHQIAQNIQLRTIQNQRTDLLVAKQRQILDERADAIREPRRRPNRGNVVLVRSGGEKRDEALAFHFADFDHEQNRRSHAGFEGLSVFEDLRDLAEEELFH